MRDGYWLPSAHSSGMTWADYLGVRPTGSGQWRSAMPSGSSAREVLTRTGSLRGWPDSIHRLLEQPQPPFVDGVHFTRTQTVNAELMTRSIPEALDAQTKVDEPRPVAHKVTAVPPAK